MTIMTILTVLQETVPLAESLSIHQMLSACLEETILRNINYIAGDSDFQDRNRYESARVLLVLLRAARSSLS